MENRKLERNEQLRLVGAYGYFEEVNYPTAKVASEDWTEKLWSGEF